MLDLTFKLHPGQLHIKSSNTTITRTHSSQIYGPLNPGLASKSVLFRFCEERKVRSRERTVDVASLETFSESRFTSYDHGINESVRSGTRPELPAIVDSAIRLLYLLNLHSWPCPVVAIQCKLH